MLRGLGLLAASLFLGLYIGLSGCGPASPDPIERTGADAPSGQATAMPTPAMPAPLDRTLNADASPWRPPAPTGHPAQPEHSPTSDCPQSPASPDATCPDPNESESAGAAARQQWLAEALVHPDTAVRRQALEAGAAQPSRDLGPLTYALVDEDDSVRARAQELYEQHLAREAMAGHAPAPSPAAGAPPTHQTEPNETQDIPY